MQRYRVTMPATLVFEIDAPNPDAARGAIFNHFRADRRSDPLQGTRFALDSTERQCANPSLMTTTAADASHWALDIDEVGAERSAADLPPAQPSDAAAFRAAGFVVTATGGGATAWRRPAPRGCFVLITGQDGASHELTDAAELYLVGVHDDSDSLDSDMAHGAAAAIKIADELAAAIEDSAA